MADFEVVTHNYIGTAKCGCVVAVTCDVPSQPKWSAKSVADFIKSGLTVTRISHEEFRQNKFGHRDDCLGKVPAVPPQGGLFR